MLRAACACQRQHKPHAVRLAPWLWQLNCLADPHATRLWCGHASPLRPTPAPLPLTCPARLPAFRHNDNKDVDYINDRNAKFNAKVERAFGAFTQEIKANLERGTALPD